MINYLQKLGGDKQLNEIVMAGSHDAAITFGPDNAKTQYTDILDQAQSGVRFFDIRVAAETIGGQTTLKAFHAPGLKTKTQTRTLTDLGGQRQVEESKLKGAKFGSVWGLGLTKILNDALTFVQSGQGASEFIILKFDKCTNWALIAETCRNVLNDRLYDGSTGDGSDGNNINQMTLSQLAGKVICAFLSPGYRLLKGSQADGITEIQNLYKPPAGYNPTPTHPTLQYWGAGGTKINNKGFEGKIKENISTQKKILKAGSTGVEDEYEHHYSTRLKRPVRGRLKTPGCDCADPNALGMMYWTTTGVFKDIRARNRLMWDKNHRSGLKEVWESGLNDYIDNALPDNVDMLSFSSGGLLKTFMPNIVMIDFASTWRCRRIVELNDAVATTLVKVSQDYNLV